MMKKFVLLYTPLVLLFSCNSGQPQQEQEPAEEQKENKISNMNWLIGSWKMSTPGGDIMEWWKKDNDSVLSGQGLFVTAGGDTAYAERIRLEQHGDVLMYIPTVSDQNDGQPVVFTEKTWSANEVVFENKEHDFPQRIIYKKISDDNIFARIEGMQNGEMKSEEYNYMKSK